MRQKSKQRTRSVLNALAMARLRSKTSSCCSKVKSALNWSCRLLGSALGLYLDLGAPGQSVLKSGLAISVTRNLFFCRMRRASATSLASRLTMFLSHMPRNSIHCMPNSLEATSQTWPKSCPISSLITAILNGERDAPEKANAGMEEAAAPATVKPKLARKSRRETENGMEAPPGG